MLKITTGFFRDEVCYKINNLLMIIKLIHFIIRDVWIQPNALWTTTVLVCLKHPGSLVHVTTFDSVECTDPSVGATTALFP